MPLPGKLKWGLIQGLPPRAQLLPDASQNIQVKFATHQFSIAYLLISSPLLPPIAFSREMVFINLCTLSFYLQIYSFLYLSIYMLTAYQRHSLQEICSDLEVRSVTSELKSYVVFKGLIFLQDPSDLPQESYLEPYPSMHIDLCICVWKRRKWLRKCKN